MSFNTFMQMTNSWEAARASLGSLSGSSSSANSNKTLNPMPKQKTQKYIPSSGPPALSGVVPAELPLAATEPYDYFDTTVNANAIAERTNSLRRLRRAGYANRSFMYHGEYPIVDDGYGDDVGGDGGGGGRLPYFVEPTYRSLEYDRRQRRRHSVHQLANFNPSSKLDDLRQRFDEYNSSAAVPRGAYYGYYTLDRHKKLSRQMAPNPLPPITYGKAFSFGQSARYSGSRSLDRVLVEEEREGQRKGPKRGSRSSQGSTDSNNSTHSASSGSLLLTVANLENFAKIHRKSTAGGSRGGGHHSKLDSDAGSRTLERYLSSTLDLVPHHPGTLGRRSRYNSNILLPHQSINDDDEPDDDHNVHPADHAAIDYRKDAHHIVGSTIVPIDEISIDEGEGNGSERQLQLAGPNAAGGASLVSPFRSLKGKDPDSVSVASSTHFTMVNGIGGPQRVIKTGICSSGHQITILIVTMSIIFMIGICSAVFLLEMRAREMPK
ncbi:uncharacterized protein LOC126562125 isoform X1 [Anopheles maculipalpis]|uniref:uncharacterized protein LOC126562125 isoform X1 n=2 Tax=Anopheles maculipalpis TaxID=1496333 RepID=UPI0021591C5B|nr:uncharacterized protein LOC126562125 isoform X1 [Anopheles maculipalpis]